MKIKNCYTVILISLLFINFSCSKSDPVNDGGQGISQKVISIKSNAFISNNVSVKVGTVVKWINNDNTAHTVTSDDNETFDSDPLGPNGTFSYTESTVGVFPYHCTIHGPAMAGTLTVNP